MTEVKYNSAIESLLVENYITMNNDDLAELLEIDKSKVRYLLNKLKLKRVKGERPKPRPFKQSVKDGNRVVNLLSDDLEAFYWVGYFMADGWSIVTETQNHTYHGIGFTASDKDSDHLAKLSKFLNVKMFKGERTTQFVDEYRFSRIQVIDTENVLKLNRKFDVKPKKSYNPPDVTKYAFSKDQTTAFIIGYIDGDGTIASRTNDNTMIGIQTHESWKPVLEWIHQFLHTITDTPVRSKVGSNCRGHAVLSLTSGKINRYLKGFAVDANLPIIERKWSKIKRDA